MNSSVRRKIPNRISNLAAVKKTNHAATEPDSSTDGTPVGASGGGGLFSSCSFADLGLHSTLCQELQERLGFKAPTTIQAQAIPVAISGRHVLVNAATGTGKTIAYLTPIVHLLQMHSPKIQRGDGTFALVLVPTRELCMQVYEILQKLLHRFHWIVPGYVMGGEKKSKEKSRLRKGISILIATPGRLLDHLKNTSSFSYKNLRWIVFDEADSILELGFGKAIEEILEFLDSRSDPPSKKEHGPTPEFPRQHLLLSATLNEKVNQLANISLDNPVMIRLDNKVRTQLPTLSVGNTASEEFDREYVSNVSTASSSHAIEDYNFPEQLVQRYVKVPCGSRLVVLASILKTLFERDLSQKIVVFFSTCDAVDFHHSLFGQFCWSFDSQFEQNQNKAFLRCQIFHLHGKMKHGDRRTTFQGFSSEKSALLLCTDVAARGLDFPNVRCIIQYDSPGEATEYVHRVGRTARLGEKGEAILFLQPIELDYLHDLKRHGLSLEEFPVQKIMNDLISQSQKHWNRHNPSLDMHPWVLVLQKALESRISRNSELQELAKDAFATWVKAYSAHRGDLKRIFMVKKLHLGHVARSFGLKEQPSLVGRSLMVREKKKREAEGRSLLRMQEKIKREQKKSASSGVQVKSRKRDQMKGKLFMMQVKKRKRDQKQGTSSKRKRVDR